VSGQTSSVENGFNAEGAEGLAVLAHRAQAYANASGAAIALPGAAPGEMICRAASGSRAPDVGSVLRLDGTFTGLCVESGKLLRCDDTELETRVDLAAARALGVRSIMVAPIGKSGSVRGVFALFSFTPNAFTPTHEAVLKTLADEVMALLSKAARSSAARVTVPPASEGAAAASGSQTSGSADTAQSQIVPFPKSAQQDETRVKDEIRLKDETRGKDETKSKDETRSKPKAPEPVLVPARTNPVEPQIAKTPQPPSRRGSSKGVWAAFLLIALIVIAVAYWYTQRLKRPDLALASTIRPTFRIHGSNTLGADCVPALVKAYLSHLGATDVRVTPVRKEEVLVSGKTGKGFPLDIEIQSHGSFTGFKDLADGKAELAMASTRLPDPGSVKGDGADADSKRTTLDKIKELKTASTEFVVGLDGIAVIASQSRAASTSLSKQQVCDIFAGKIANWSQVDPAHPGPISTFVRDKNSGTRKTFVDLCYEGKDNLTATGPFALEDSHQLSETVSKDGNAIGFVGLPFVAPASPISVDRRTPSESSVRLEEYALTRRLYLYRNKYDPAESGYIRDFIEFSLSPEGQNIVRQMGFIDQEIKLEQPEAQGSAPRDYVALTAGAKRASLEVRFESSSANVDSKAMRDLARLKTFLQDSHASNQDILVLGFADKTGTPTRNCMISKERAHVVEDQLHRLGLANTTSVAFGQAMPLTLEGGPEGMAKNRRVEIWVADNLHPSAEVNTCP